MNEKIRKIKHKLECELYDLQKIIKKISDLEDDSALLNMTADERGSLSAFSIIADKLEDVVSLIKFEKNPVWREGELKKQKNGRYALDDFELSDGSTIEILEKIYKDENIYEWVKRRVEYREADYYAHGSNEPLENALIRIRM